MSVGALDSALTGLHVAQQQLGVIAGNVSNASTPGYTRKILPQSTVAARGATIGVTSDKIIRSSDINLARDLWTQTSSVEAISTRNQYLTQIQQFHGDPSEQVSIAAEVAKLRDTFSSLSDSPENTTLQRSVVSQAQVVAGKINKYANLVTQMRNDAQSDMSTSVNKINGLLNQIASLNQQIQFNTIGGVTTAAYEDLRDEAVRQLSEQMSITTYTRSDGTMVVQTAQGGAQLADGVATPVYFQPSPLGAQTAATAGIYVGGNPAVNPSAVNITNANIGGTLGALVELRDNTLPGYQAQIDELAEKLAQRFDDQGLRLFTDASGAIPANSNPVPGTTPVPYVGFASLMQVNKQIVADNTLVQKGTAATDLPVASGSNEVLRRIAQFTFGDTDYQVATGTVDIRAAATGTTTLQQWFGLYSSNQVTSSKALSVYNDINALITAGGTVFTTPPTNDSFTLTFGEARTGTGPVSVNIDLTTAATDFPINGTTIKDGLDQIVAEINQQITAAAVPASLAASASRNIYGQLVLKSTGNITVDASGAGQMGDPGLQVLGLTSGTTVTQDPYIDVQVGNDPVKRITIEPGDTETDLMAKLEYNPSTGAGVPGLYADISATGRLTLRPGGDNSNGGPRFGGDISITGGPFNADGTGTGGTGAGASVLKALFGSDSPVANVAYNTAAPFRTSSLGPNASIDTGVISSTNLIDYAQQMVNRQTEDATDAAAQGKDETAYRDTLQSQLSNQTGVNVDEELAHMITVQTAYAASARVITAVNNLFEDLLSAFR